MTDANFLDALNKVQGMQRKSLGNVDIFSISTKSDDYYGDYMEITVMRNGGRWFLTTYSCVSEDEYSQRIDELNKILDSYEEET